MKKLIISCLLSFIALLCSAQTYVDLGLPSGTKWATTNADSYFTYEQAVNKFGDRLPSKEQWEELVDYCDWEWTGRGYKLTGPNSKSIFLPAAGWLTDGMVNYVGHSGVYCSSSLKDESWSWSLFIQNNRYDVAGCHSSYGQSIRLVE